MHAKITEWFGPSSRENLIKQFHITALYGNAKHNGSYLRRRHMTTFSLEKTIWEVRGQ